LDGEDCVEDCLALRCEIADFCIRVHAEHLRDFCGKFFFDVLSIAFIIKFGGVWRFEEVVEEVEVGEEKLGLEEHFEVGCIGSSIPVVGDMSAVHDFAEDVFEVIPGNDIVFA
jgi:hypothetical protein